MFPLEARILLLTAVPRSGNLASAPYNVPYEQ